ncbi:MAG: hypothetical protein WC784_01910 [Candidatus Shapirobacteria bacterium]|jgi:hypothetical protein
MKIKEKETERCKNRFMTRGQRCHGHGNPGAIYGLGMIGALFYFLQNAVGFGAVIVGIGKAIFWPALVVFRILDMLGI